MKHGENVYINDFCVDGDEIWFIHVRYNALLNYNLISKKLNYVYTFYDDKNVISEYSICKIIKNKNLLILIPNQYKKVLIFNTDNNDCYTADIDLRVDSLPMYGLFRTAVCFENMCYMIPSQYDSIVELDTNSLTIKSKFCWRELSSDYSPETYISDYSMNGEYIFLLVNPVNDIVVYSIVNKKSFVIKCQDNNVNYKTIVSIGNVIFAQDKGKGVVKIDVDSGVIIKKITIDELINTIFYMYKFGDKILVDFVFDNRLTIFDSEFEQQFEYYLESKMVNEEFVYFAYSEDMRYGKYNLYFNNSSSELFYLNERQIVYKETLSIEDIKRQMITSYVNNVKYSTENEYCDLKNWLSSFIQ